MMKNLEKVTKQEIGMRLDKFLTLKNPQNSRQEIQSWIKNGNVLVNGFVKKANYKVTIFDEIVWKIPQEVKPNIEPENIPLEIIYEDDYILVINKERGMIVHPTVHKTSGTLVNALLYYSNKLSNFSGDERPGIVHRLDKDTSGVMVIAKTNEAHEHLQNQFMTNTVYRKYEAVVYGMINHNHGIIDAPIGRDPNNRFKRTVISNGRNAKTKFNVIEHFNQYTHVACELITGRTHQIRVHMQYLNNPIIGDPIYSNIKTSLLSNQALYAKELKFTHPGTKEYLTFKIEQPIYIKTLLDKLRKMT